MNINKYLVFYLVILIQLTSTSLFAQCNSFYKTYQFGNRTYGYDIVELSDTSYLLVGKTYTPSITTDLGIAVKINSCGDTIWSKIFSPPVFYLNIIEKFNEDKIIVFSGLPDTINTSGTSYSFLDIDSGYLCCVNSFLTGTNGASFQRVKQLPSGKYFCTINPFLDALHSINVVDSNLNYLYNAVMPGPYIMNPIEDHDGNYYVCSATEQFPYYIVAKYDSLLNQIWYLNTGTANSGNPFWGYSTYGIQFSNDSNLLVVTDGPDWQLMKVNRFTGDTMWTKLLPDPTNVNYPWYSNVLFTKIKSGMYVSLTLNGVVIYFDDNGDIQYTSSQNVSGTYTNLEPTMDGGVIFVGYDYITGPIYRLKVVKLDSLGNTVFTSEIELGNMQKQDLNIYPNPASDAVTFEMDNLNTTGSLSCTLYNIQGKACMQFEISNSKQTIDVSEMPSGLYLLKASNENVAFSKLFMVSH